MIKTKVNPNHNNNHEPAASGRNLTPADIEQACERISPFINRTPLVHSRTLSERLGTNVYLKLELFQKTGSFKVRGAFNKILTLPETTRQGGVVAISAGNHAQAVAYAARSLAAPALIIMPESTPRNYVQATRNYGAEILLVKSWNDGFTRIPQYQLQGWTPIHPFDDPLVVAGQGSIGREIVEDLPETTDVVASIGGGGLVGGIGVALAVVKPNARIWGVETEGAASMTAALVAGRVVELSNVNSVARTLAVQAVSNLTLQLAQEYLEGITIVSDAEAIEAMEFLLERAKVLTEPAASCTLAAAERLRSQFSADSHVVLVLCGGNIGVEDVAKYKRDFAVRRDGSESLRADESPISSIAHESREGVDKGGASRCPSPGEPGSAGTAKSTLK